MIKKTMAASVGAVLVIVAGAVAYYYLIVVPVPAYVTSAPQMTESKPDNTLAGGAITAVSSTTITILKQDNTSASFAITADTQVILGDQDGGSGIPKKSSDLTVGAVVLITPSHTDATQAQVVLIIPLPTQ